MRELRQEIDYLGGLRNILRDLQGYDTLIFELIQNADDALGVSTLSFEVRNDALVVENDGWFRDEDFNRLRLISGGGKRSEAETTGAFGIGFVSVYQITDRPEIHSAGRKWVIHPDRQGLIEETLIPDDRCTRFVLPWATSPSSPCRSGLAIASVDPEQVQPEIVEVLLRALPNAMLFLRKLRCINVSRNGTELLRATQTRDGHTSALTANNEVTKWRRLTGDFRSAASDFRLRNPGTIEAKRTATVEVALPEAEHEADGLWFATLPTRMRTESPVSINADFLLTTSRKEIVFDVGAAGQWNGLAAEAAAAIVCENLQTIMDALSPAAFWQFMECAKASEEDSPNAVMWKALSTALPETSCILTRGGNLVKPSDAMFLRGVTFEDAHLVLDALEIEVPDPALDRFRNTLTARPLSVPLLTLGVLERLIESKAADGGTPDAPSWLHHRGHRAALAATIDSLAELDKPSEKTRQVLAAHPMVRTADGRLRSPSGVMEASADTVELFKDLDLGYALLDTGEATIRSLMPLWSFGRALQVIEDHTKDEWAALWSARPEAIRALWSWIATHREDLQRSDDLKGHVRDLPIWPAGGRLHSLDVLVVPGDFHDPLGLSLVLDRQELGNAAHIVDVLGAETLSLGTYVSHQLPRAFASVTPPTPVQRRALVQLLATRYSQLTPNQEASAAAKELALVECRGGSFRPAGKVYWPSTEVGSLLGNVPVVDEQQAEDPVTQQFYEWLGVSRRPRIEDVLTVLNGITDAPPNARSLDQLDLIVRWLGEGFRASRDELQTQVGYLKTVDWLPAVNVTARWHRPTEVYTTFRQYLFATTGTFVALSRETQEGADQLLKWLGVASEPSVDQVVVHARNCAREGSTINREIYPFLGQNAEARDVRILKEEHCICMEEGLFAPSEVFWEAASLGDYARVLPSQFREYQRFFDLVGVQVAPDHKAALHVLARIETEHAGDNRPVSTSVGPVIAECWRILERDIHSGTDLSDLSMRRVVANSAGVLEMPSMLFVDDRPGLVEKFGNTLRFNVIRRPEGAWRALEAAGVRRLSEVVVAELVEEPQWEPWPAVEQLLSDRQPPLRRVLEQRQNPTEAPRWSLLTDLEVRLAEHVIVSHRFVAFGSGMQAPAEEERVYYDGETGCVYVARSQNPPWTVIARELLRLLLPEQETATLAAAAGAVLAAGSSHEAENALDDAGLPRLVLAGDGLAASAVGTMAREPVVPDGSQWDSGALRADESPMPEVAPGDIPSEPVHGPSSSTEAANLYERVSERFSSAGDSSETETTASEVPDSGLTWSDAESLASPRAEATSSHDGADGVRRSGDSHSSRYGAFTDRQDTRAPRRSILYSYVTPKVSPANDDRPQREKTEHEREIERAGIDRAMRFEKEQGREVEEMPPGNPGYDLRSVVPESGDVRYIEVKALGNEWVDLGVGLTSKEFDWARTHGEAAWLYVVERALEEDARLFVIQDPVNLVDNYRFDHNWRLLSDPT